MKNKVRELQSRLSNSKDGKALAGNFGYMMLLQISGYLFPLITIPYLARVVGVEGFGKIAFAAAVVLWFQTITDWGFNYTATRDVAQNRDNPEKVSEIFSNVLWARILLMILSFGLLLLAISLVPYLRENQLIILLTFFLVPGHIMFPEWFFQAVERMKFITFFGLISKALFTVMVFVFIKDKEDFILQPVFMSLGNLLCGLVAMYLIVFKWKVKMQAPSWGGIMSAIKKSTDVFINNLMPNLYNSFSTILIGLLGGSISAGLLDAGRKFVEIAQQFLTIIARVFFPFLSRNISQHGAYVRIQIGISIFFCLTITAFAPWIIELFFTPEFEPAVLILQIMSVSIVFLSLYSVYGTNYMIIMGRETELRNITAVTSAAGFALAFPLIYYFDYLGAAITITLTRSVLGLAVMKRATYIQKNSA
ncbi:flippase [Stutzerimonas stutzeri]|uniref:flippase n=1 Tax=Stutzerimonas stutzeri TaxID=316 RepID=UPI003B79A93E